MFTCYNGSVNTTDKEKIGQDIIKQYHLWDILFPNNTGYKKVTNKKLQLSGVDYIVYDALGNSIYVDLKSCVGTDYTMHKEDYVNIPSRMFISKGIPLEVYQNSDFTYTKGKLTDYLLFIIKDDSGIYYYNMKYEDARNITKAYMKKITIVDGIAYERFPLNNIYAVHTSNNKSGSYIKYPVGAIKLEDKK